MISVIIPTYNREKTIEKSIASVLAQDYQDIEVVVVDDGSTDDTEKVVKSISDTRVRYIRQDNKGACAARNHGALEAKGEFIAFQDSDDTWKTDKLRKQLQAMEQNPEVGIVCCRTICERTDGSSFVSLANQAGGVISKSTGPYGISTQTLLVRRWVLDKLQFDINVTRYQDLDFLLCAMKMNIEVYLIPEILVERHHEENSISNHPERIYDMTVYFQKKHSDIMNDKSQLLSVFLTNTLIQTACDIKMPERRKFYKKAFEINRNYKTVIKIMLSIFGIKIVR